MIDPLFEKIYTHPAISPIELNIIVEAHESVAFKKGEVIFKAGKTADSYLLIEKGLARAFVHDFDGNEITTDFQTDGEICIEVASLFQRIPSTENIIALTEISAWKIDYDVFQKLFHGIEGFREWGRAWMANQLFMAKQLRLDMITKTAAERYLILLKEKPEIIRNAPLKYIASYLGITDTSLSRVRNEIFR